MALPSPRGDSRTTFYHCLAVLTDLLGADIGPEKPGTRAWYYKTWTAIRHGLRARETLPDQFFDALIRAGIYDPNPSRSAHVIKPAVAASAACVSRQRSWTISGAAPAPSVPARHGRGIGRQP